MQNFQGMHMQTYCNYVVTYFLSEINAKVSKSPTGLLSLINKKQITIWLQTVHIYCTCLQVLHAFAEPGIIVSLPVIDNKGWWK